MSYKRTGSACTICNQPIINGDCKCPLNEREIEYRLACVRHYLDCAWREQFNSKPPDWTCPPNGRPVQNRE